MSQNVIIIDYGAGNIQSLKFALSRLGVEAETSSDVKTIKAADKVIFPGVGHAESAMEKLKETGLHLIIPELQQPVLGICLGMQLMCRFTEEGPTQGLGIFDVEVKRFETQLKVPHMGWNLIKNLKTDLFQNLPQEAYMYFVHSYYVPLNTDSIADSDYGCNFCAALKKHNFYGVQFHPEKSSQWGEKILDNFLKLAI
ncbi:imidazole glycerol phosphate synthase subunit HisH [Mesohalobacter halotolerans]|jgi:glutamine amidotransferase|uniref:Imidazole glycerol phosphate synthase subunit HisH n=1 Tax=Mesohalobacter halotolerans TaxID=1883405 RepID=A0A4U5TQF7_9FLAO|nr:imidazole glycerol phosphate synthase subunit HisH [Mesohalobacter halotolerans]MBS3739233.1 imidazole glycerol phosphate synthase subunit HisH [Psychroflexus sp.]NBC56792.1 imidazole glycerol phosphate synthase subunit HisH [Bacteroidota bacterium]TKS56266.1 imidazole glycerol phosphate synthase subunit HisH [Mesohalobacter halotolerans]